MSKVKQWLIVWFKAARAPFLVVSAIPALLGGVIAYAHGAFDWTVFLLAAGGVVMAHSAADFIDDYFDYQHGNLGNKVQQFHDSPLISGEVTLRQVLVATILCAALAAAAGIALLVQVGAPMLIMAAIGGFIVLFYTSPPVRLNYRGLGETALFVAFGPALVFAGIALLVRVGAPVLIMAAIGGFIVLFYTSPPVRLNYRGLGETALFVAFGPALVFGVYFVLTETFSWVPLLASFPLGIFTMNVGIVSNTFDYDDDVRSGKYTLPVRLGQQRAVQLLAVLTAAAYIELVAAIAFGWLPLWCALGLLTLPLGVDTVRLTARYADSKQYAPAMGRAIALSALMGLLLSLGYWLSVMPG